MTEGNYVAFVRHWWGYVLAAFFAYPLCEGLLKHAGTTLLAAFGMSGAMAISSVYFEQVHQRKLFFLHYRFFVAFAGLIGLTVTVLAGVNESQNIKRCDWLQKQFVDQRKPSADAASAFQALGCTPRYAKWWNAWTYLSEMEM